MHLMKSSISLLACALLALPLTNSAQAEPQPLRSWARTQLARQDYGLYMMGRKVGWMTMEFRLGPDSKAPGGVAALASTQATMRLRSATGAPDLTMLQEQKFSLAQGGPLLSARLRTVENGRPTTYSLAPASLHSKQFRLSTWSGGREVSRTVTPPRETLEQTRLMMQWLSGRRKAGEEFPYWSTSLDSTDLNSRETLLFRARQSLAWGGVAATVYQVTMRSRGTNFEALLRPNGMFVRGQMAGIDVRAEEPRVARDLSKAGVDLLAASLIRVDRKLGAPWKLSRLQLEATGMPGLSLPQSKRQRVTRKGQAFIIDMAPEAEGNAPQVLTAAQKQKYLAATTSLQSDDPAVRKLARSIVGDEKDVLRQSRALMSWVYRTLGKSMDANSSTALQVLATKKGDCTEHALLFTTLARSVGIPAREVSGLAYIESPEPMFGWHAWSEVNDGAGWISIDPTWEEARVDASHIKFSDDADDLSWTAAIGKLKLRVLDAQQN